MLKLYYRPSDMKLVHSVNGWPEKPTFIKGGVTSNDQWEVMNEEYEEALQKAIEEAVPLEDQFIAKNLIYKCMHSLIGRIKPLKPGEFYEVSGEVEIVNECHYEDVNGNCTDCFRGSLCEKIARLLPDREPEKQNTYSNSSPAETYSIFRSEGISKVYKNGALIMATSQDISTEQIIDFEKINKEFLDKLQEPIPEPSLLHESIQEMTQQIGKDWVDFMNKVEPEKKEEPIDL